MKPPTKVCVNTLKLHAGFEGSGFEVVKVGEFCQKDGKNQAEMEYNLEKAVRVRVRKV